MKRRVHVTVHVTPARRGALAAPGVLPLSARIAPKQGLFGVANAVLRRAVRFLRNDPAPSFSLNVCDLYAAS